MSQSEIVFLSLSLFSHLPSFFLSFFLSLLAFSFEILSFVSEERDKRNTNEMSKPSSIIILAQIGCLKTILLLTTSSPIGIYIFGTNRAPQFHKINAREWHVFFLSLRFKKNPPLRSIFLRQINFYLFHFIFHFLIFFSFSLSLSFYIYIYIYSFIVCSARSLKKKRTTGNQFVTSSHNYLTIV